MKNETTRQAIIRLLRECLTTFDSREAKTRKSVLLADLIKEGHLEGVTNHDEYGIPNANRIVNITLSGRLYLDELEKAEYQASTWGKIKKRLGGFLLWLLGIATPMIVTALKKAFHQ